MEFVSAGPLPSLWATILLFVLLVLCGRAGGAFLYRLGYGGDGLTSEEKALFSLGTGITALSLGVFFIGLLGFLNKPALLVLLALFLLVAFKSGERNVFVPSRLFSGIFGGPRLFVGLAVSILFLSWLQALAPPIGTDALSYHLYHPRQFVLEGRIHAVPFTRESLWPYLTEMLFTLGLVLQGTVLAQLFHWAFYGLCAGAVYAFTRRFNDERTAQFAGLIFLVTPVAFAQSGHPYVDLSFAFFVFLSVYPLFLRDKLGEPKAALLSGMLCGAALSTKYLALGAAALLCGFWVLTARERARAFFCFLAACGAVAGAWYLRSWIVIGNPVYPFFPKIFGGHGFELNMMEGVGKGGGPPAFLAMGWNMTMHPYAFGGEMIGPLFLLFVPYLLFEIRRARPSMRTLAVFTLLYTLFLFTQSQHMRFYLSVATFLSVGAGVALQRMLESGKLLRRSVLLVLAAVLLVHSAIFTYRLRTVLGV
ncbi:MAG: ArnT family glycosyltransferase, partial [Candidatus Omnitrophota bacterium]